MKNNDAVFGLRPVSKEFIGGNKWPIEEIKITNEADANITDEMLKEFNQIKEQGTTLDELITDDCIQTNNF